MRIARTNPFYVLKPITTIYNNNMNLTYIYVDICMEIFIINSFHASQMLYLAKELNMSYLNQGLLETDP